MFKFKEDLMADFQFYLNRQGIRGLQGVKGDQGDSPIITVQTETPNEYILKITNPDGTELISPNLRGNKININEGTYVRYNTETGELYTSTADGATGELAGVVRLATDADVTNMDEKAVVTPSQLADALSKYLVSPDGSVKIVQNAGSSLTELTAEKGLTELPIASADTLGAVKIGENLSITEDGTLTANDSNYIKTSQVSKGGLYYGVYLNSSKANHLDTVQPIFTAFEGALETFPVYYLKSATYSATEPADEDMVNNWTDNKGVFTGYTSSTGFISGSVKFQAGSGSLQVVFKLMEVGHISGIDQRGRHKFQKIEISTDGTTYTEYDNTPSEARYIRFTFDYFFGFETIGDFSTRIRTLASNVAGGESIPLSVKVDNQTIQIVDDKLHANFDEINGEVSNVSSRVTTLEGQVGGISTTLNSNITDIENLKETKNNNIFDIGKFTVVGNPTITNDGVASGFSNSNYINTIQLSELANKSWDIEGAFEYVPSTDGSILGLTPLWAVRGSLYYVDRGTVRFAAYMGVTNDTTSEGTKIEFSNVLTTAGEYYYKLSFNLPTGKYTLSIYDSNKVLINSGEYTPPTTNKQLFDINNAPATYITISKTLSGISDFIGTTNLKQFSITVDGKEVFNGLMESTKPIYDKITTLNTDVRDFELETSNNFSAVNSALNEKANLSDLSKCASLADFNRLSDTVTSLENQVGDVSAVLDNINGEVV